MARERVVVLDGDGNMIGAVAISEEASGRIEVDFLGGKMQRIREVVTHPRSDTETLTFTLGEVEYFSFDERLDNFNAQE